ncbi:putative beta-glucan synthesis-associated, SKN1 [Plasmopara halstedii]
MMGNLGRAIFSASTNRMWPFSYNKCEPDLFDPKNQRIGGTIGKVASKTGKCVKSRCECTFSSSWGGPRCTTAVSSNTFSSTETLNATSSYGPPMTYSVTIAGFIVFVTIDPVM